jgi:hypothetical protein
MAINFREGAFRSGGGGYNPYDSPAAPATRPTDPYANLRARDEYFDRINSQNVLNTAWNRFGSDEDELEYPDTSEEMMINNPRSRHRFPPQMGNNRLGILDRANQRFGGGEQQGPSQWGNQYMDSPMPNREDNRFMDYEDNIYDEGEYI